MATLPGVTVVLQDGNLNTVSGNAEQLQVKLGVAPAGTANTLYSAGDLTTLASTLGLGSLYEACAYHLSIAGGPVLFMPVTASQAGSLSAVTHSGTGSGTLTVADAPHQSITITITTGGALGAGKFTYALNGGAPSAPTTLAASFQVPGTYTTLTFAAGTYILNDTYTFNTDGTAGGTHTGPSVTQASSPIDDYNVTCTITTGGANGTAQFTYSLDGTTASASAPIITPASGAYGIPNTGIVLTFGGTQTAGDTFTFQSCGPTFGSSDLSAALTALETTYLSTDYSMVHVVGKYISAAAAATAASALDTAATALFNAGKYVRFIAECPTVGSVATNVSTFTVDAADTDSAVITAFQSFASPRVAVGAGGCNLTSSTGLSLRRNAAWVAASRASAVEASRNIGEVGLGAVTGVTKLFRDEFSTPGLDAARFITLRSFPGLPGFYLTDGHTMALVTSDFAALTNARVIDKACTVARQQALPLVNAKVETSKKIPGAISEKAAQKLEGKMNSALSTSLVDTSPQDAVGAKGTVNRTHNILADSKLIITIAVQPYAYSKFIELDIGFAATV